MIIASILHVITSIFSSITVADHDLDKLKYAHSIMLQKLEAQAKMRQSLEAKIGVMLGVTGAIIAGMLALIGQKGSLALSILAIWGLSLVIAAFISLGIAASTRTYYDPPDFDAFYSSAAFAKPLLDYINQVVADSKKSYEKNAKNEKFKAKVYQIGLMLIALGVIIFIIAMLIG